MELTSAIFINNMRLYAYHGVLPQERRVGGWFTVSIRVHYNIIRAMESDSLTDTLSYADLCQLIKTEMAIPSQLLEHVAGRIAKALFHDYPQIQALDLTLTKENPPMGVNCEGAGVELHLINNKTKG